MISSPFFRRAAAALAAGLLAACGGDDAARELPAGGLYATIAVGNESFHVSITHPDGEAQARALWQGSASAGIPTGTLVCRRRAWNEPWRWHLEPESVRFADVTTEVCDGEVSYVEANCESFGAGRYCPWAAELTGLRDCSAGPDCPPVPR